MISLAASRVMYFGGLLCLLLAAVAVLRYTHRTSAPHTYGSTKLTPQCVCVCACVHNTPIHTYHVRMCVCTAAAGRRGRVAFIVQLCVCVCAVCAFEFGNNRNALKGRSRVQCRTICGIYSVCTLFSRARVWRRRRRRQWWSASVHGKTVCARPMS